MRLSLTLSMAALILEFGASRPAQAQRPKDGESLPAQKAPGDGFLLHDSDSARAAHGAKPAKLHPTATEAVIKFFVIEKDKGAVKGVVVSLTSPSNTTYYTDETDAEGYAEVLVPVGQKYDVTYLSLGRRDVATTVTVTDQPKQNIKLTLRFKRLPPPPPFVLTGVNFDTAKATVRPESFGRLDLVVDFMKHKKSARVEISGHTDNVGKPTANLTLSENRAMACRTYLISKGIDGGRITAAGYGDQRPLAPNDSDEARQKNRRIEVVELPPAAP